MSVAYYNEHDKDKAAWLRELIKANLIAPGEVDERDIQDVLPRELVGYTQCHFFAGIGIWSYSLRCAGWPDDRPVWTGSCPCQPFSAAGKRAGFADERHLWPAWYHLLRICKPDVVFGEQTAKKDGLAWLDLVQSDLEAAAYAVGAVCIPAGGFGAPHIRERIYFVADALRAGWTQRRSEPGFGPPAGGGESGELADAENERHERDRGTRRRGDGLAHDCGTGSAGVAQLGKLGDSQGERCREARTGSPRPEERTGNSSELGGLGDTSGERLEIGSLPDGRRGVVRIKGATAAETGIVTGVWRDAELVLCNDPEGWKWRAIESGSFPLAHGAPARVLRLRGYGDGICAPVAEEFIRAYLEARG